MEIFWCAQIVISLIVICIIIYKKRIKSPRFRIVETETGGIIIYTPQVRVDGVWFYLLDCGVVSAYSNAISRSYTLLDPQDALALIDKFKTAGNYTIPSNQKLKSNQKSITVE